VACSWLLQRWKAGPFLFGVKGSDFRERVKHSSLGVKAVLISPIMVYGLFINGFRRYVLEKAEVSSVFPVTTLGAYF